MLNAQEQADVVYQLGYPGTTIVDNSVNYNKIVVDRLTNLSTPIEGQVRALLVRVKNIDTKLSSSTGRMLAKKIGDIELRDGEAQLLRSEKKAVLRELSDLLDIPVQRSGGSNISVCV